MTESLGCVGSMAKETGVGNPGGGSQEGSGSGPEPQSSQPQ